MTRASAADGDVRHWETGVSLNQITTLVVGIRPAALLIAYLSTIHNVFLLTARTSTNIYICKRGGSSMRTDSTKHLRDLRRKMVDHFNLNELKSLSFDLSVDWDSLDGDTIALKSQALISYLGRRGRLSDLIILLREERPNVDWAKIPVAEEQVEIAFEELLAQYIQLGDDLLLATNLSERRRIWRMLGSMESKLRETESRLTQKPQQSFQDIKTEIFAKYQKILMEEYELVYKQISFTLNEANIIRLKREANSLEEDLMLIEKGLSSP